MNWLRQGKALHDEDSVIQERSYIGAYDQQNNEMLLMGALPSYTWLRRS